MTGELEANHPLKVWLITNTNLRNLKYSDLIDVVPASEIKEICRLHNKIYTGYDYFDLQTTTIYSDTAYWWLNGDMGRIS